MVLLHVLANLLHYRFPQYSERLIRRLRSQFAFDLLLKHKAEIRYVNELLAVRGYAVAHNAVVEQFSAQLLADVEQELGSALTLVGCAIWLVDRGH